MVPRLDQTAPRWHEGAVGIPIVVGWNSKIRRTGAAFLAPCPHCANVVKMHEAVKHTNVNAFLAISLWDGEDPVVQCADCLALFEDEDADRLRARSQPVPSLFSSMLSSVLPSRAEACTAPPSGASSAPPSRRPTTTSKRPAIDDASIDAELAAMKKRLGK